MPTEALLVTCLVTGLASFVLPPPLPLAIAVTLCALLFHFTEIEQEQEENQNKDEFKETFIIATEGSKLDTAAAESINDQSRDVASLSVSRETKSQGTSDLSSEDRVRRSLAPSQLDMAMRLIKRLKADPAFQPDHPLFEASLINARRFLAARNWHENVAEALWRKAASWRVKYALTERRAKLKRLKMLGPGFDPAFDFADKHWFVFKTGPDRYGTPGIVTRAGTADPYGVCREVGTNDVFVDRVLDILEEILEDAIERDVLDRGICEVPDVREYAHVPNYFSRAYASLGAFKQLATIEDECYVERIRKVVIVGAPSVFMYVWQLAQPLIPKNTKKKIVMTGANQESKWVSALREEFPESSIFEYMGGSKPDSEGVLDGLLVPKGSYAAFQKEYKKNFFAEVGLIADVQHADTVDGQNFRQTRSRRYRGALQGLKLACEEWKSSQVDCILQVGDLIDGVAAKVKDSQQAIDRCLSEFAKVGVPVHHVIGNHDLYNFDKDSLSKAFKGASLSYRSFKVRNYRFIVLDAYDVSVIGVPESSKAYETGKEVLLKNHPRDWRVDKDWLNGILGVQRRFVPYNGGISTKQLDWLRRELEDCVSNKEYAIIVSHVPLQPGSCSSSCLVWNYEQVLDVIRSHAAIKYKGEKGACLVLAGHDHKGGYAIDDQGIHYVTLAAPLEAPDCNAHGVLRLGHRGMMLKGSGIVPDRDLFIFREEKEVLKARESFVSSSVEEFHKACLEGNFKDKTFDDCKRVWFEHGGAWDALPEGKWPMQYPDGG